jgi:UPF0716 protein FxsA
VVSAEQSAQAPLCGPTIDDPGRDANLVRPEMRATGKLPMSLVKWIFVGFLLLAAAELGTFILVALDIGWLPAIALLLIISAVGAAVLKNAAREQVMALRAALATDAAGGVLDGPRLAPLLGGILLVVPGFITGLAGALLLLPKVQGWAGTWASAHIGRLLQTRARKADAVVDLEPDQWHHVADPARAQRALPRDDSKTG